jgi:4-alpha-glucanotransferase
VSQAHKSGYLRRESGLLLHPTSLPGAHGIGDLGAEARRFVDFLDSAGQRLWQILPLGPLGSGNSPYASPSAMAGNPLLISLDLLADEGLIPPSRLREVPAMPTRRVDYAAVAEFKVPILKEACRCFQEDASSLRRSEYLAFLDASRFWLEDYALFAALKEAHGGRSWLEWEPEIASRRPAAMEHWHRQLHDEIVFHQFIQYLFHKQWGALKQYANLHKVRIVGDIPIFVALDSSDVWARPELFHLDSSGNPTIVSGVPPDYFSKTGQRWGNPLYRWDVMGREGYNWWVERFRVALSQLDVVRIDHFRGFQAYWEVPAQHKTAEHGRWIPGPGMALFRALEEALGSLPVIAEDLGVITPEVEALRLRLGYPGMKVLHFAFDSDSGNPYLPHNFNERCVVYTGTHDNDTTIGWFQSRSPKELRSVLRYLGTRGDEIHWELIRAAMASVAMVAIVPLQDVLGLGSDARMNQPGLPTGNWGWRFTTDSATPEHASRLREMTEVYGRIEPPKPPGESRPPL